MAWTDEYRDRVRACTKAVITIANFNRSETYAERSGNVATDADASERTERAIDMLRACMRMAWVMGGETFESFERCAHAMAQGKYRLYPDSEALCLNFRVCGMIGMMVFFESDNTWSLHT